MLVDTNVLIRLLTGDPPDQADRAEAAVAEAGERGLILTEIVLAECAYVLESAYRLPRGDVAAKLVELLEAREIRVAYPDLLRRAIAIYDEHGLDFADAYLCALDLLSDAGPVLSFDRGLDAVPDVQRQAL